MPEAACNYVVPPTEVDSNLACLSQPWKGEKSPAFHAARNPGELKSQSGRNFACHGTQVAPKIGDPRTPPEPKGTAGLGPRVSFT
jgi:hypothetical protein